MEDVVRIAEAVDAQWDMNLFNSYSCDELRALDVGAVSLPVAWFDDWLRQLDHPALGAEAERRS